LLHYYYFRYKRKRRRRRKRVTSDGGRRVNFADTQYNDVHSTVNDHIDSTSTKRKSLEKSCFCCHSHNDFIDIFSKRMHPLFTPNLMCFDNCCEKFIVNPQMLLHGCSHDASAHKYSEIDKRRKFFANCVSSFADEENNKNANVSLCESLSFVEKNYEGDISDNVDTTNVVNIATMSLSCDESEESVSILAGSSFEKKKTFIVPDKDDKSKKKPNYNQVTKNCGNTKKHATTKGVRTRAMCKRSIDLNILSSDENEAESTPIASRTRLQKKKRIYMKCFDLVEKKKT
jgi:hypothetical protein